MIDAGTDLIAYRASLLGKLEAMKAELANVERVILSRLDPVAIFDRHDKTYGEITETIGGHKVKLRITKTVKWDSDRLLEVAKTMPWSEASKLFKIEFSMGEKEYKALEDKGPLRDLVDEARTVKFSEPKLVDIELN